jgi:Ca2+/H+ antiporter
MFIVLNDRNTCACLMFLLCIIRRSRNNQHYAQIWTTALFYTSILAPTYFGSSLLSSGRFRLRLSYMKIHIDLVVYHIMLVKWPMHTHKAGKHNRQNHDTPAHRPHYMIIPPNRSVFSCNSDGTGRSLMIADYCRNM